MKKRIKYKGKYAFIKRLKRRKSNRQKNYGMMATKVMIPSVDEQGMWA
jgi:hypothetical protein